MARSLFLEGTKAAKAAEWARARDAFAASYALHPSPRTLFNLGIARAELDEVVAACEALRAFLREADRDREADNIAIARREIERMEPQIAYVRLEAQDAGEGDRLEVDGRLLPSGVLGTELPLDPGPHRIRLITPESTAAEQQIEVTPGQRTTIQLVSEKPEAKAPPVVTQVPEPLPPAQTAPPLATQKLPERDDDSRTRRRIWIGASVALVVSGAALATFLIMRNHNDEEKLTPVESNVTRGVLRVP